MPLVLAGVIAIALPLGALEVALVRGWRGTPSPSLVPLPPPRSPTQTAAVVPAERSGAAVAWDAQQGRLVLFGGFGRAPAVRGEILRDTWTWTSAGWSRLTTAASPPARVGALLVPARAGQPLLLFGGYGTGGAGPLVDSWLFGGNRWSSSPGTGPAPSTLPTMAATGDGQVAISPTRGGATATWRFTSGGWVELPIVSPTLQSSAVTVTEPGGGMLLVGRAAGGGGETWRFDGTAWARLANAGPPVFEPIGAVAAIDPATSRPVLQSGIESSARSYTWSGDRWAEGPAPPTGGALALVADTGGRRLLAVVADGGEGLSVVQLTATGWAAVLPSASASPGGS